MSCSRGKANPNAVVQKMLFAASGGYCQNPGCNKPLFHETATKHVTVAEMAHIFAAEDRGPRADTDLTAEQRGSFSNLILLCANCHTLIDKAPDDFPDDLIIKWKADHESRIASVFGAVEFGSRAAVREALKPLFTRTRAVFERIGPNNDYRANPEAEEAREWQHHIHSTIVPTNRTVMAIIDRNRKFLRDEEWPIVELFRQHIEALEQRHIFNDPLPSAPQYPNGMDDLFSS